MEQLAAFLAVSGLVIVTPGPDTLLTVNNTLAGGRAAGFATAAGVSTGQLAWTLATAVGLSALLVASEPAFVVLKVGGAAYLAIIGLRAMLNAIRGHRNVANGRRAGRERGLGSSAAYRRGLLSNLGNPKMAVFFVSLLPQFAPTNGPVFAAIVGMGVVFCLMTLAWLSAYAAVVARAGDLLRRGAAGRWLEGLSGAILMVLGIGLALEPRRS
jgi:threonine/homoserine/homoserine lactone efflux protein